MKSNAQPRQVVSRGVQSQGAFGISLMDAAAIMTILRDTLYTDKVLAVMREYASNAWDAHREVGKGDVPIKVTIPTTIHPVLVIRDYGPGLSEDQVFNVYTQYGKSTKRESNEAVGMLGIGCKSGFAYSDSFVITSWNGGWKKVYVAVLDSSDVGVINKQHEEPCGGETGLEIQISVRPSDVLEFHRKAMGLFPYFNPPPDINIDIPKPERAYKEHGYLTQEGGWHAIMGCIPYRLNFNQIMPELEKAGIWELVSRTHGGVYFDIGEVQISANREELKYSTLTKEALIVKFNSLVDAYIEDVLVALRSDDLTPWEKRLKAHFLTTTMKLPLPDRYKHWGSGTVHLWGKSVEREDPKTFTLRKDQHGYESVLVETSTRIVIKDDPRPLRTFRLNPYDYVLHPRADVPLEEVRKELDAYIKVSELTGIPITMISLLPEEPKRASGKKFRNTGPTNKKHLVTSFVLRDDSSFSDPWSDNWDIVQWEPSDNDVFVILEHFRVKGTTTFYEKYAADRRVAKAFGVEMPRVYGYKTTMRKPVVEAECQGTEYFKWRVSFLQSLVTPKVQALLQAQAWDNLSPSRYAIDSSFRSLAPELLETFEKELGPNHLLTRLTRKHIEGVKTIRQSPLGTVEHLNHLKTDGDLPLKLKAQAYLNELLVTYPLLVAPSKGLSVFADAHLSKWIDYIKLVDRSKEPA